MSSTDKGLRIRLLNLLIPQKKKRDPLAIIHLPFSLFLGLLNKTCEAGTKLINFFEAPTFLEVEEI